MPRLDHAAFETRNARETAQFYADILDARIVEADGHPVMAYVGTSGFAFHEPGGPGPHTAVRVSEEERLRIRRRLDEIGAESWERDHGVGVGLFFRDPDGRLLEAITYRGAGAATTDVLRSAIVVPVPEAAPLVDPWRLQHTRDAQLGVPAHITVLFPFVPAERIDRRAEDEIASLVGARTAFDFALTGTARFPDTLYLVPEPREPFVRLTELIVSAYPGYPPYEGAFAEIVPHLTVAHGDAALFDRIAHQLEPQLPLGARATAASLLVEGMDGSWRERRRIALAAT